MEIKEIPLGKLNVDLQNFRIGAFDTTREAYAAMIEEQGQNLVNLARSIVAEGLSPVDPIIVGEDPDNPGSYIVFEGNRRITSLKLLQTPGLAAGTKIDKEIAKLSKEYKARPIKKIAAAIAKDKDTALTWIERKHTADEGRGIVAWKAQAQARFEAYRSGTYRPSKAVIDHLEKAGVLTKVTRARVAAKTTNIDRVFQMPYFRKTLGIEIDRDGSVTFADKDYKHGNALLVKMLKDLSGITVDHIKSAEQRRTFIEKYSSDAATPTEDTEDVSSESSPKPSRSNASKSAKSTHTADTRKTLAHTDREHRLSVQEQRLTKLYKECRELDTEKFAHSASVLMRVFLELSAEYYLVRTKTPLPLKHKGKRWSDFGVTLKEKIEAALGRIDPGKTAKFKSARTGVSDPGYLHSIDELHQFVHGLQAEIVPKEARTIWDRWYPLLDAIYTQLFSLK